MPPLDDELRAALHGRAATLPPLADPVPGVERRVRGLRRRRAAASVAGTALAVLAVAGVVPALTPDRTAAPSDVASSAPSAAPSPAPSPGPSSTPTAPASAYALDPADPWRYRGLPHLGGDAQTPQPVLRAYLDAWYDRHPGTRVTPLFGHTYEPSGHDEVVLLSEGTSGPRWGVVSGGESGAEITWDVGLEPDTTVLVAVLPGPEERRLLAVAAPEVERLQRVTDPGDRETRVPLASLAQGVATGPLPSGTRAEEVRGLSGDEVVAAEVLPDAPPADSAPDNVLEWEPRGTLAPDVVLEARATYAAGRRAPVEQVREKVLFAGDDDAQRRYLVGQFWLAGDDVADTLAVVVRDGEVEPQLYRPATEDTDVVVLHLSPPNEQSRSELVVVPRPGTGQVQYAGDDASEWVDKDTEGLDGVVLLTRNPEAERTEGPDDLLRLLDGDGREITTVSVRDLLCGKTSCS